MIEGRLLKEPRKCCPDIVGVIGNTPLVDRKIVVSNRDAIVWTQKLFFEEGIFAGVSSGAIAHVAVRVANELDEGNVVFVVADDGSKYMSAQLWTKSVEELEAID